MAGARVNAVQNCGPALAPIRTVVALVLAACLSALWPLPLIAQVGSTIATSEGPEDSEIAERLHAIFRQIDTVSSVEVSVVDGVVRLAGSTANEAQAARAVDLAGRIAGVVAVEDDIERTLNLSGNVTPLVERLSGTVDRWIRAWPLALVALTAILGLALIGHRVASWASFWRWLAPNVFLAELLAQAFRIATFIAGAVVALNIVGATAIMGAILGGAGVLGLAVGFAVRDSLDNYISSIMLSLRQPFRANDHVLIDQHEGRVARLTSRATVLVTLDGNHLRIPNSTVFKAVILNYSRNPERRFTFELGIDANDDPVGAMSTAVGAVKALSFILEHPRPVANIETVGDSNVVLSFMAWIDQRNTDFLKARSLAVRAAKNALETQGFTLPEPIYRLRFDQPLPQGVTPPVPLPRNNAETGPSTEPPEAASTTTDSTVTDLRPDTHLEEWVAAERLDTDDDLLDRSRPVE